MKEHILKQEQMCRYFEGQQSGKQLIGVEQESFLFYKDDHRRVAYQSSVPGGLGEILSLMVEASKAQTVSYEHGHIVGFQCVYGGISIEPGGQLEFSNFPRENIHDLVQDMTMYRNMRDAILKQKGVIAVDIGFDPLSTMDQIVLVPKRQYRSMVKYFAAKGGCHSLDMMCKSAAIHVNIDYISEEDMVRKMRLAYRVHPFMTALLHGSPFSEGRKTVYPSYRMFCWEHTDEVRCGLPSFVFDDDFGFHTWVNYLLGQPLVWMHSEREDVVDATFQDFVEGKVPGYENHYATEEDFDFQVGCVFPLVRLKKHCLEIRGADNHAPRVVYACAAFWRGLFYTKAFELVEVLLSHMTYEDVMAYHRRMIVDIDFFKDRAVRQVMGEILQIIKEGLQEANIQDHAGRDEAHYLLPLFEFLAYDTQARSFVRRYDEEGACMDFIFEQHNEATYDTKTNV